MGACYRVAQFVRAITAFVSPEERAWAGGILGDSAFRLFETMPKQDQRHGLRLAKELAAKGWQHPDLLAAALLHDVGKADSGLTVFHRSVIVLLESGRPSWLVRLGQTGQTGWRRPFWVHWRHAQIGAQRAAEAGCSELTAWLIEHHHTPLATVDDVGWRELLSVLQREDGAH